jgi:membrane protease YdiL (CAAX protease family)
VNQPPSPINDSAPADGSAPATSNAAPPASQAIAFAHRARFCGQCGALIPPDSDQCAACVDRAARQATTRSYAAEMGDIKSAMRLYFALLAVSVVVLIWTMASAREMGVRGDMVVSTTMAAIVVAWSIACREALGQVVTCWARPRWYLVALICPLATYLLATACLRLLGNLTGLQTLEYLRVFQEEGWGFGWAVLLICIQPAIFEELAFRGVIQGSLQRVVGPWQAAFVSAGMFAILHLSLPSMFHLVTLGAVLGWLRMSSGSIYPGMVVHFLHNLLAIGAEKAGGLYPW